MGTTCLSKYVLIKCRQIDLQCFLQEKAYKHIRLKHMTPNEVFNVTTKCLETNKEYMN